jgi:hypothetical protein
MVYCGGRRRRAIFRGKWKNPKKDKKERLFQAQSLFSLSLCVFWHFSLSDLDFLHIHIKK